VTRVVDLIRASRSAEARDLQAAQAAPLADRLERLTNQLVNKAEADMVAGIEASTQAYANARRVVIAFAFASIALALGLGYAISWSVIGPVKKIEARPDRLSAADFTQRVQVANRDELGTLAANVNKMCEELGRLYGQIEMASQLKRHNSSVMRIKHRGLCDGLSPKSQSQPHGQVMDNGDCNFISRCRSGTQGTSQMTTVYLRGGGTAASPQWAAADERQHFVRLAWHPSCRRLSAQ
jgi:HAMP domain-containing protein